MTILAIRKPQHASIAGFRALGVADKYRGLVVATEEVSYATVPF